MGVDVYTALDALLAAVGPGVATHPLPLALGAAELPEAPLLALVRRQAFALRPRLWEEQLRLVGGASGSC